MVFSATLLGACAGGGGDAPAAAHEAAARCQESGRKESECMAELARACKGIAIGKYCGMRHD